MQGHRSGALNCVAFTISGYMVEDDHMRIMESLVLYVEGTAMWLRCISINRVPMAPAR